MKVLYYDKDYDKWNVVKIKTAVIEDSGVVKTAYGDNLKEVPTTDPYGRHPYSSWFDDIMPWIMFGSCMIFIACCIKYLFK